MCGKSTGNLWLSLMKMVRFWKNISKYSIKNDFLTLECSFNRIFWGILIPFSYEKGMEFRYFFYTLIPSLCQLEIIKCYFMNFNVRRILFCRGFIENFLLRFNEKTHFSMKSFQNIIWIVWQTIGYIWPIIKLLCF